MDVGVLFSGGKDSCFAAYKAKQNKDNVKCLISVKANNNESWMFHTVNIDFVKLQAKAMNLPLVLVESAGKKELELNDLKKAIELAKKKYNLEGIYTGALASVYQQQRVEKICEELDLECISPSWDRDLEEYMEELIEKKFEFIIVAIGAEGLNEDWLGRKIDENALKQIIKLNDKFGVHIGFEGGEAETFVVNCPLFSKKIVIKKAEKVMDGKYSGRYIIKEAELS